MPYRLFTPKGYRREARYPLVVWLHGAGGVGSDNLLQISGDQVAGTRTWTRPEVQAEHPSFVLVPQGVRGWGEVSSLQLDTLTEPLALVVRLLAALEQELGIDPARVYLAGQSIGGLATWDLIAKRPDLFAAAIPLCGRGDPARAPQMTDVAVWAFHGEDDASIPVTGSREMIAAIREAGGQPRYTEYAGVGHDVWTRAFAEPGLIDWVFAQHK
jgi:predicted peptidase